MFNLNKFIADSVTFRPVSMKYMINGWEDLICYREDGNYDIDTLAAERAIRPFTVHRKNALSFGSEGGVKEACVFFTLCETCNQAGIIIRNVKNELFHSAKRLILNEVKGIECLLQMAYNQVAIA